jgi:hypothetical protein
MGEKQSLGIGPHPLGSVRASRQKKIEAGTAMGEKQSLGIGPHNKTFGSVSPSMESLVSESSASPPRPTASRKPLQPRLQNRDQPLRHSDRVLALSKFAYGLNALGQRVGLTPTGSAFATTTPLV